MRHHNPRSTSILNRRNHTKRIYAKLSVYENRELEFPKGSFLVLTSDAVTESRDAEGQLLGIEGLCDLIGHVTVDPGNTAPLEELLDRFFAHIPVPADDDRTLLWIGR